MAIFSLALTADPREWKHPLVCKQTKAKEEILEILGETSIYLTRGKQLDKNPANNIMEGERWV